MSIRNLENLLRPKSVALVGASSTPGTVGYVIWKNLNAAKFEGSLYPVNLKYKFLDYSQVYRSVKDLPEVVDLVIICTPPSTVVGLISELGLAKVKAAIVITTGLSGQQTQEMLHAAKPHMLRILGPNSLGVLNPKISLNASVSPIAAIQSELAFVSQSNALSNVVLDWAKVRSIGFSQVISLGDSSDIDVADCLDYLGSDSSTRAIVLYVDRIESARKFMSSARAAARNKPVIILEAPIVESEGVVAPANSVLNAAIARAGMLRVDTLQDLFTAVMALTHRGNRKWKKLFIVSNSVGAGQIAANFANRKNLPFSYVAIDGEVTTDVYAQTIQKLVTEEVDAFILVVHAPTLALPSKEIANILITGFSDQTNRVATCWLGEASVQDAREVFRQTGIADYSTPEDAVQAFAILRTYFRHQELLMEVPANRLIPINSDYARVQMQTRQTIVEAIADKREWLSAIESNEILELYAVCTSGAHELGLELYAGSFIDPLFGPIIRLGRAGLNDEMRSEINADTAVAIPPLNSLLADELIAATQVSTDLLALYKNTPEHAGDVAAVLQALSKILADIPEIRAIHINKLCATAYGVVALEAKIQISDLALGGVRNFAILPYPDELVASVLWGAENTVIRPIRPEDDLQHRRFLERLTSEDIRMRIFFTKRELSPSELARLTQIDYDREMAFIAERDAENGLKQTLAVVRVVSDPDGFSAEFALVVRSDLKRQGLGRLMLLKAIEYARHKGLKQLIGSVLRENIAMKELVTSVGFVTDNSIEIEREAYNVILKL
jgi:acetyltransferase